MDKSLRKLQLTEFKILCEFDRICRKNKINYSLSCGTLLGAIRHKGFIPWDDDIDVMMTWDNYVKFEQIASKELKKGFYFQSRNDNPQNFIYWNRIGLKNTTSIDIKFNKVKADWGICIDIFPIIPLFNENKCRKREFLWLRIYSLLSLKYFHMCTFKGATIKDKLKKLPHILIPVRLNQKLTHYFYKKFSNINFCESKKCVDYAEYKRIGELNSEWFTNYTEIEFENQKFMAVKDWDKYLTTMYGNYMVPPEENNREKHSDNPNVIIDYNNSYEKYLK